MSRRDRQLKAIVFSDVVNSSAKIFADELIAIQRIKEDLALIREELHRHDGSLVKSLGDGLLATFDGPTQALEFIQASVEKLSARGRQSLAHRFGLHTGEIYADGDDILGQGVHLASRLQTISPVNGVAFVRSTYDLIDARFRRLAQAIGEVELKGLPEPMQAYCIRQDQLLHSVSQDESKAVRIESLLEGTSYELVRPLGRSPVQQTLLLQDCVKEQQVVMKLIPADFDLVEALQVEAACLDRLRHPRIPRVLDGYARAGFFCFLQEYIPGVSLQGSLDLLRRKQRLAELLRQVLQVLEQVHAVGLVHGDIHPANLIPAAEGGPLFLVDFSLLKARLELGRHVDSAYPTGLSEAGRPFFSAPERARFGRLTPAADLYALGVSALTLYTGQDPASLYDESQGCWALQDLEPEVVGWLAPLLEDLPARRLQHAADALRLLDQPAAAGSAPVSEEIAVSPSGSAGVNKQALQQQLLSTYGPMVELLLESQASFIPEAQVPSLVERLVAAGLARADIQEALRTAQQEPGAAPRPAVSVQSPTEPPTTAAAQPGTQLTSLRQLIGPIADLLWTAEMDELAAHQPQRLWGALVQAGVPESAVQELQQQTSQVGSTAVTQSLTTEPCTDPTGVDGEQLLLQLVGPIGSTVWAEVAHLPPPARLDALEKVLRGYGLDELRLAELRRQLEGG